MLHVLPWLNYGGVETYVVKLATALARRGHRVAVASSGGLLEGELAREGIPHHRLHLARWHAPAAVVRLVRLIEREHVGLVCAHNWTSGAVGYLAARWTGVPFVFTVHGLRGPLQRYLVFYWGRRVIAVSPQSRDHLIQRFGLPPERVRLGVIGVDVDRFCPGPAEPDLLAGLGLDPQAPTVVHVSRFSHSKAGVAMALAAAARELEREAPGTQVVLVGSGPRLDQVRVRAEQANRELGRQAVICTGGRGNVEAVLRAATAVVGTATVALEGMATGKPVVAAGKAGMVGLLTPENLTQAAQVNFGDHGALPPVTSSGLAAALQPVLVDAAERERLARFGREVVLKHYTTERMAELAEEVCQEATGVADSARVLVFHLNQVGDLVFSLPALRALRQGLPQGRIISVVPPHLAPLLECSPYVDKVVCADRRWQKMGPAVRALRAEQPEVALGFSQSPGTSLLMFRSGARRRVGYVDSHLPSMLTQRVPWRGIPTTRKLAAMVEALAIPVPSLSYQGLLTVAAERYQRAQRLLEQEGAAGEGPLVVLGPGASGRRGYKTWDEDKFAQVGRALAADGTRVVVVGTQSEQPVAEAIARGVGERGRSLAGKTDVGTLAALLAGAALFVGVDSGPMHVAAAMQVPVVALFGPTDPELTGPQGEQHQVIRRGLTCSPCKGGCEERPCLAQITVEEVLASSRKALER